MEEKIKEIAKKLFEKSGIYELVDEMVDTENQNEKDITEISEVIDSMLDRIENLEEKLENYESRS